MSFGKKNHFIAPTNNATFCLCLSVSKLTLKNCQWIFEKIFQKCELCDKRQLITARFWWRSDYKTWCGLQRQGFLNDILQLWAILCMLTITRAVVDECVFLWKNYFEGWNVTLTKSFLLLMWITIWIHEFLLKNFCHCRTGATVRILSPTPQIMTSMLRVTSWFGGCRVFLGVWTLYNHNIFTHNVDCLKLWFWLPADRRLDAQKLFKTSTRLNYVTYT